MKNIAFCIIFFSFLAFAQNKLILIEGQITDSEKKSPLNGAIVSVLSSSIGAITDSSGYFKIKLSAGKYKIRYSFVGYQSQVNDITVKKDSRNLQLNVSLKPKTYITNEVTIVSGQQLNKPNMQVINDKDIVKMPNLFSDVMRGVKILPGVTSNNELTSAYYVRGGNYNENLIYLNGFTIYRPFLIQEGVEENQSVLNQNMAKDLHFYNGAFPAYLDDKISSALQVNYLDNFTDELRGDINLDLFYGGIVLKNKVGNLNWIGGFRYSYPSLFLSNLQTKGMYHPTFKDVQLFTNYVFPDSSNIEVLFIYAKNKFDLTPTNWVGNFQTSRDDVKEVKLNYSGQNIYNYENVLIGISHLFPLSSAANLRNAFSYYSINENSYKDLAMDVFYSEDAYNPDDNTQYLKTRFEKNNNDLKIKLYEYNAEYRLKTPEYNLTAGTKFIWTKMDNVYNESNYEAGPDTVLNAPYKADYIQKINFNSVAGYIQSEIFFSSKLQANAGARLLKYYYNNELLLSPRLTLLYYANKKNTISASWGIYYQPPFFYEVMNKDMSSQKPLLSQKANSVELNWETIFKSDMKFTAQLYYKRLTRLIPYDVDKLKIIYGNENNAEGYAYGMDLQYQGELIKGTKSWIGYSYLNSQEKNPYTNNSYRPTLLDQTHTIRIFLQDRMPKYPNFQAHVLFLIGSGFRYYLSKTETDPVTGMHTFLPDYGKTDVFPFYSRIDMGLSFAFPISDRQKLTLTADVYNVFDKQNIGSYDWYHVFPTTKFAVHVPNVYSPRFFNVAVNYSF